VPFRNCVGSLAAVALHLRVASNDADPFPQRTGSCDPVLPPGPFRSVPGLAARMDGWESCSIPQALRKRSSCKSPVWITHLAEVTAADGRQTRRMDRRGTSRGQGAGDRHSGPAREPRRPITKRLGHGAGGQYVRRRRSSSWTRLDSIV
jgi:hypothetical protein